MSNLVKFKHSPNWYARFQYEGNNYQKSLKTTNKRLAQQLADKFFEEVIAGLHNLGDSQISIDEAITNYMKTKPNNINEQRQCSALIKWLPQQNLNLTYISDISSTIVEKIVELKRIEGKKEGTIQQNLGIIWRVVAWAKRNGYATSEVELPKIKVKNKRLRYLSFEEEERLLQELHPDRRIGSFPIDYHYKPFYQDNYDLAVLLLDTGARVSEITTLKWNSIDLKAGTIALYRKKVGNESVLHMTNRVKAILTRRSTSKRCDYVFSDSADGFKKSISGIVKAIKRANLEDVTVHTFRHTCASRLIQNGMSLYEVASILGHSNISMTQRYAHLAASDVSKKARDVLNKGVVTDYNLPQTYTISSSENSDIYQQSSVLGDISKAKKDTKRVVIS